MISKETYLKETKKVAPITVELENETSSTSTLNGKIHVDSGMMRVLITNVYYILVMKMKIISCIRLDERGVSTEIKQGACMSLDKGNNTIFEDMKRRE